MKNKEKLKEMTDTLKLTFFAFLKQLVRDIQGVFLPRNSTNLLNSFTQNLPETRRACLPLFLYGRYQRCVAIRSSAATRVLMSLEKDPYNKVVGDAFVLCV